MKRREISNLLLFLSRSMKHVAEEMYKSEDSEIVFHAEELLNAANIAVEWALEIENRNAKDNVLRIMDVCIGKNNG